MSKSRPASSAGDRLALLTALEALLLEGKVTTQESIRAALEEMGYAVNQSKISRMLRKVGAVKSKNEHGNVVYRLPHEPAPPTAKTELSTLIIQIASNEHNVIIQTSPGAAQLVGRILDYHKAELGMLGCIAGDDTIFVSPQSVLMISDCVKSIRRLLS